MKTAELKKHIRKLITLITLVYLSLMITGKPALSDEPKQLPENLNEIFIKGKLNGVFKTLYYQRIFDGDTPDRSTLAIGGNLNYETAPVYGFTVGIGFKTSQGDYSNNNDEVYRGLLAFGETPYDDKSYTALDEYFFRYTNWDTQATLGAQGVDTPWLNGHDIRMTPKKYKGFSVINASIENVELHGYYLTDWLDWVAEDWESITSAFTGDANDDAGALAVGAMWQILPAMNIQAWNYYFRDIMNSFFLTANYTHTIGSDYILGADLRYLNQTDVGDQLAGSLGTYTTGGYISLEAYGARLTLSYGTNGSDDLLDPFGQSKVIALQNLELDRADEDAYAVKLEYAFDNLGIDGLGAYVFFGSFDTPETGENASPDAIEIDFNLQYKLGGWFKNCSIRLRHAIIDQDEDIAGGEDWTDSRVYLVYTFSKKRHQ
jgi:hypothetical protein